MPHPPLLEATELVVNYKNHRAIDRLNLLVPAGCVYAMLGGNGAGKTTAISTFLGFIQPSSGRVSIDGDTPMQNPGAVRAKLAYLPENVALYDYMSGLENLGFFCALAGIQLNREQGVELLNGTGLQADAHHKRVANYSKGMRQKVGLAIADAKQAKVMLLDEPTSGLDPSAANDFAQRIRNAANRGRAVLLATHDLFNARQVADRIGIMKAGRLVEEFDAHSVAHDELEQKYLAHARGLS
ncbi:ABC transporter ATP-binding protein [Candidatus Methylospira mobilis]|uniref:ABC transporter ATP-binding protein n=1 Tax=Candidatus Methylospira mobilis TaxID=1808979 RepID=A0A5Q0BF39_9GAMM|nr:ABC transporter ATP-binding protein [Candidatus Methylospira mobilis]QFY41742.1 ABC transporter ATP-binding protein [Candidatus Methylospira mobilis]WNV06599.1 ABC transporter ATP-binding protein [Candidatus Methylospira mobilis]